MMRVPERKRRFTLERYAAVAPSVIREKGTDSGAWGVQVPIMLQSQFCILDNLSEKDMYELNECPYDKGGYFVINGSEKVLIAQERMATNRVYVFAKSQPSPVSYLAEIRSAVEKGGKTISSMQIKMMRRTERQVNTFSRFHLIGNDY